MAQVTADERRRFLAKLLVVGLSGFLGCGFVWEGLASLSKGWGEALVGGGFCLGFGVALLHGAWRVMGARLNHSKE